MAPQRPGSRRRVARCLIEWTGGDALLALADRRLAQRAVDAALAEDGLADCLLVVALVDDAASAALHRTHFGDPAPTDVMTFPDGTGDPETGRRRLGDLAVGAGVARRVAVRRRRPVGEEIALYVLHGLLHLLGHDDRDPADRRAMWARQAAIMGRMDVPIGRLRA
jgi:probable rRNA maturation factor